MHYTALTLLTVASIASSAIIPQDQCDVIFQQDVFTHSKNKHRPLRIKMIQNQASLSCTLTVRLPTNHTTTFSIAEDEIETNSLPTVFQDKIRVKRASSDKLWLEISSLEEQESRSGVYVISGHTVFGVQTPPFRDNLYSPVENITCTQQQQQQQFHGVVSMTLQFYLCHQYNIFVGNSRYLRYDIQNVTVNDHRLNFIAMDNDRGYQVVKVFCDISGGDGVKVYKIMFNLDTEQCPRPQI